MFKNCAELSINLFAENHTLYINHDTHWMYICLYAVEMMEADFMNELTTILNNQHHMLVKSFSLFPGRIGTNSIEVLCISFEQNHEGVQKLLSDVATMPKYATERFATAARFLR